MESVWEVFGFRAVSVGLDFFSCSQIQFLKYKLVFKGKNIMQQGKISQNCHQRNAMKRPELSRTYTQNPTYTPNYTYRIMITIPLKIHLKLSGIKKKKKREKKNTKIIPSGRSQNRTSEHVRSGGGGSKIFRWSHRQSPTIKILRT